MQAWYHWWPFDPNSTENFLYLDGRNLPCVSPSWGRAWTPTYNLSSFELYYTALCTHNIKSKEQEAMNDRWVKDSKDITSNERKWLHAKIKQLQFKKLSIRETAIDKLSGKAQLSALPLPNINTIHWVAVLSNTGLWILQHRKEYRTWLILWLRTGRQRCRGPSTCCAHRSQCPTAHTAYTAPGTMKYVIYAVNQSS